MNRRTMIQMMSHTLFCAGAATLLLNCATTGGAGGGGSLPPATKENPFVNSLGMKFVPVPGTKILMCTTETTNSQYAASGLPKAHFPISPNYLNHGSNYPVQGVLHKDAESFCRWLSTKEGKRYRLPTNAEWSAAVGNGVYPWGNQWPPPNNSGNYPGQEQKSSSEAKMLLRGLKDIGVDYAAIAGFSDRHALTAPVGSYPSNSIGIYDLGGNSPELTKEGNFRGLGYVGNTSIREGLKSSWVGPKGLDTGFRCVVE